MDKDPKGQQNEEAPGKEEGLTDRRGFLMGLGRWSKIVIGSVLVGSALFDSGTEAEAAAWANRRGGGGAWANRAGGGAVVSGGGGAWANRAGGGGAWANRGAAWANRGAAWVNRY